MKFLYSCLLPTYWALFNIYFFKDKNEINYIIITLGNFKNIPILVRIHSECFTGDVLFSIKCDCGLQLKNSFKKISKFKNGIILYLKQEGRGIGLENKFNSYYFQNINYNNTINSNTKLGFLSDQRNYNIIVLILKYFNIKYIRLLTNNPHKIYILKNIYIKILEIIPLIKNINIFNKNYLIVKINKLKHLIF